MIAIEDDGAGEDPERVRRALAGDAAIDSVGLGNVDERLRTAFGDDYGLVVETAPGAGTKVTVRVPKYAPGVAPMSSREQPGCASSSSTTSGPRSTSSRSCSAATPRVAEVLTSSTPPPRRCGCCRRAPVDAVFLDIAMPGLTGLELAQVLAASGRRRRSSS